MSTESIIREHHLSDAELREFFAQRRQERDVARARAEQGLEPPSEPFANED